MQDLDNNVTCVADVGVLQAGSSKHQQPPVLRCDIAVLAFDSESLPSAEYAISISERLPGSMPRIFVPLPTPLAEGEYVVINDGAQSDALDAISSYCKVSS